MVYLSIAFRNLGRQKRRTMLLAGAIAFGVLIITMLNGFTRGIVANVEQNIAQMQAGHIFVTGREISGSGRELSLIRNDPEIEQAVDAVKQKTGNAIRSVIKRSGFMGTLVSGSNSCMQKIEGVDWSGEPDFKNSLFIAEGSPDDLDRADAIVISASAADLLKVQVGETVLVKLATVTGQQNIGEFRVAAMTADTGILGSFSCYAGIEPVNRLLNMEPGYYQQLTVRLAGIRDTDFVAGLLYDELEKRVLMAPRDSETASGENSPGGHMQGMGGMFGLDSDTETQIWKGTRYEMKTINDMLSSFKSIVSVIDMVGLAILLILLAITMVGIVNTFRMIIIERIREIGTMRAIGVKRKGIRQIFLSEAFFLATVGVLCGFLLALVIMFGIGLVNIPASSPLYMFTSKGHPVFVMDPSRVVANYLLVGLFSMAAAFFPAHRAAKLDPASALRK